MKPNTPAQKFEPTSFASIARRIGRSLPLISVCAVFVACLAAGADDENAVEVSKTNLNKQKQALAEFNKLIGAWRGVGMPRRGSRTGAWTETAEWVWQFGKNTVAVDYKIAKGKLLRTAQVTFDPVREVYLLSGRFADKTHRIYEGRLKEKKLVFESPADEKGYVHRITLTGINDKRSLVLYQKRRETSRFLSRVAEVGYTRAGTSLAVAGAGEIECIVTGGKGTMPVTYKGQTYYVCCSGCKTAFDEDPQGVIAEYKRKLAERKKRTAKTK